LTPFKGKIKEGGVQEWRFGTVETSLAKSPRVVGGERKPA